ncbi:MAG: hypothetical protein KKG99_07520 [Bacteroidetes bacterium]|nr:hypothetical protein [Bacteroidota bacterium]
MKISKKRIRNVENYLYEIKKNEIFSIGLIGLDEFQNRLVEIGFTEDLNVGEMVLPKICGSTSRFNADGGHKLRRDLPKEIYFISRDWHWKDYQGNEYSKIVTYSRERIHREPISAPNIELQIIEIDGNKVLLASRLKKEEANFNLTKHSINLLLELFGECDVLDSENKTIIPPEIIRLNWKIFPKGDYPWEKIEPIIRERINTQPKGNRPVIAHRIEKISKKGPTFFAYGLGGFSDYTVYGFPKLNIFILESMNIGNATYVFDKDWEEMTKLTKKEIIDENLYKERIIHTQDWEKEIDKLFA